MDHLKQNALQTLGFPSPLSRRGLGPGQAETSRAAAAALAKEAQQGDRKQELAELVFFWIAGQFQQAIVWKQPLWESRTDVEKGREIPPEALMRARRVEN